MDRRSSATSGQTEQRWHAPANRPGHPSALSRWAPVEPADQPCGGPEPDQPQEPSHQGTEPAWKDESRRPRCRASGVCERGPSRADGLDLGSAAATLTCRSDGSPWPWIGSHKNAIAPVRNPVLGGFDRPAQQTALEAVGREVVVLRLGVEVRQDPCRNILADVPRSPAPEFGDGEQPLQLPRVRWIQFSEGNPSQELPPRAVRCRMSEPGAAGGGVESDEAGPGWGLSSAFAPVSPARAS